MAFGYPAMLTRVSLKMCIAIYCQRYDSSILVRTKQYFGGSVRGSYRKRSWPEVTSVTWPEAVMTGSDRVRNRFPRFFLTIVVVQYVPLRMTDMATGCDVTPKGFLGRVCTCATGSEGLLTGNDVFKRDPVVLPQKLEVTWVSLGCSLGRPRPIYHFLALSLVICPISRHKGGAFNNYTKVCFRICSVVLSSLSRPRSHCGGTK